MTHPTDEELDALATRAMVIDPLLEVDFDTQRDVEQDPYGAREAIETALYLIRDQAAAITTLRTQLATLQLHLDSTNDKLEIERALTDGAHRRAREAEAEAHACGAEREAWKTRADRAEAALAAKIEADDLPPFHFDRYINGVLMAEGVTINKEPTIDSAMMAASRIASKGPNGEVPVLVYRAQPHDRTALDRMLAEAREKALREAIIEGMRIAIFTPIEQVPAAIDDAILVLIEADHAKT